MLSLLLKKSHSFNVGGFVNSCAAMRV
jgi:hypothetical protein